MIYYDCTANTAALTDPRRQRRDWGSSVCVCFCVSCVMISSQWTISDGTSFFFSSILYSNRVPLAMSACLTVSVCLSLIQQKSSEPNQSPVLQNYISEQTRMFLHFINLSFFFKVPTLYTHTATSGVWLRWNRFKSSYTHGWG